MSDQSSGGTDPWMRFECVSCGAVFEMFEQPEHCPGCGLPRNEGFGRSVSETNPNVTGFKRGVLRSVGPDTDQEGSQ